MDVGSHLHDAEQLLCALRSSPAALLRSALRALLDGLILAIISSVVIFGIVGIVWGYSVSWMVYVLAFIVSYGVCFSLRYRVWKHALFRITTERILLQSPFSLFHSPLRTIKWAQYQESYTGHQPLESTQRPLHQTDHHGSSRHFFDYFFASRPLCIRFGTADAHQEACFPSLRYAEDLKHYLDKIDSAVRKNDRQAIKPFVAKPKGRRDLEVM